MFGSSGASLTFWGEVSDKEISRRLAEQTESALKNTYKLFDYFVFGYVASEKYLKLCIEIAEGVETVSEQEINRKKIVIEYLGLLLKNQKNVE